MADSEDVNRGPDKSDDPNADGLNPSEEGRRIFIGFGINDYDEGHFKKLNNAVRDVEAVAELLGKEYGFEVFCYTNVQDTSLSSVTRKLLSLKPKSNKGPSTSSIVGRPITEKDSLIIYFSGHGAISESMGDSYFVPSDGKNYEGEPDITTLLPADRLITYISENSCLHLLLILDCCFIAKEEKKTSSKVQLVAKDSQIDDKDSSSKEILDSLFSEKSRYILTSGRKETVSDGVKGSHSPFAKALLTCLRNHYNLNFMSLVNEIRPMVLREKGGGTVISDTFDPANHNQGEFVFYRVNDGRPNPLKLKQALLELNYKSQLNEIRKPRLFNLYYLNGTELCGHHLFTHRFFLERKKSVNVFHAIPYTLRTGVQEGVRSINNLWQVISRHFFQTEHEVQDVKNIVEQLIKKLETENCVLILKVEKKSDDNKLELMLSDFWVQLNKILDEGKYDKPAHRNNFYLFVLDRRGHEKYFDKTKIEIPKLSELASVTCFPPILPIDKTDDLEDWWDIQRNSITEAKFQDLLFEAFEAKEYIVNAIAKLCDQCERQECFNDIFLKQWMT